MAQDPQNNNPNTPSSQSSQGGQGGSKSTPGSSQQTSSTDRSRSSKRSAVMNQVCSLNHPAHPENFAMKAYSDCCSVDLVPLFYELIMLSNLFVTNGSRLLSNREQRVIWLT